jgi:hypothetical protein
MSPENRVSLLLALQAPNPVAQRAEPAVPTLLVLRSCNNRMGGNGEIDVGLQQRTSAVVSGSHTQTSEMARRPHSCPATSSPSKSDANSWVPPTRAKTLWLDRSLPDVKGLSSLCCQHRHLQPSDLINGCDAGHILTTSLSY